jgi:MOSC domain-containing protein YiiM
MAEEGRIIAVCLSADKGVQKKEITQGVLKEDYGMVGDAHAKAGWHRQLSLLDKSSADKIRAKGLDINNGDFAENLTTEGMNLFTLPIGAQLKTGRGVVLEVTQIGKECHQGCAIAQQTGSCVMPTEGIFVRIIKGGEVKAGDSLKVI